MTQSSDLTDIRSSFEWNSGELKAASITMRLRSTRRFVHCVIVSEGAFDLSSHAADGPKHSLRPENASCERSHQRVELEEMCEHRHRKSRQNQRIVGWRKETIGLRFRSFNRSQFVLMRRADFRFGQLHGSQCPSSFKEVGKQGKDNHHHNSSTQLRTVWNV